jgi:hypothetical protein
LSSHFSQRLEYEVASDHDADGEARADGQGRRHGELAADDLVAGAADGVLRSLADGSGDVVLAVSAPFEAEVQERGEASGEQDAAPVIIDAVLETGAVTWAAIWPGRSERRPVMRAAGITLPACRM